jgi:ribosomal-protein-alanine N-acetyltransferase
MNTGMTSRHQIRPFDTADTAQLAALHAASFAQSWDAASITALLATPGAFAFHHGDGFVLARVAGDEAEILTLAVRPEKRGQGMGRALLQAAIARAQELGAQSVFLEVGADNPSALALYAGLGFAKVGTRKGYYASASGGSDALVLRLPLPVKFA